jgi:hypothetical protein
MTAWHRLFIMIVASVCGLASAQTIDYPTIDRVLFVEACMRDKPDRPRQEMIYKCSCTFDAVAASIPYADFAELETASNALGIAGERGSAVRTDDIREQARRFRSVLADAKKSCLIGP